MKTCLIPFFIFFMFINTSHSLEKRIVVSILTPPAPDQEKLHGDADPMIYRIQPSTNQIDITFMNFIYYDDARYGEPEVAVISNGIIYYNPLQISYSAYIYGNEEPLTFRNQSDLEYKGANITVDGNTVLLQGYVTGNVDIGDDYMSEHHITCARYSAINRYIGLISRFSTWNEITYDVQEGDGIILYSSVNGDPIYIAEIIIDSEGNTRKYNGLAMGNGDSEIFLSPNENFLIGRYFKYDYNKEFNLDFSNPKIAMIDVKNKEAVEADKDVAFTSDSQFFVTERNGEPCLVRSSSKRTLLTYKIGAPMLAAAFSPDDKTLYLSAVDNKIYVYDSGIDSACADWELLK